jgi:hypothetical protein
MVTKMNDYTPVIWGTVRTEDGGPGSGNFNHAGRPGKVGGSAPGGGSGSSVEEYGTSHRPGNLAAAYDITKSKDGEVAFPDDLYTHPEYYFSMSGDGEYAKASRESMEVLRSIKGKPEATVTIYRSSPKAELNSGDWVTLSPTYAQMHNEHSGGTGSRVFSYEVKAKELGWPGDDITEFGYFGEKVRES